MSESKAQACLWVQTVTSTFIVVELCMQDLQQMVRPLRPLLDQLARYDDAVLRPSHDTSALQALVRRARDRLFA